MKERRIFIDTERFIIRLMQGPEFIEISRDRIVTIKFLRFVVKTESLFLKRLIIRRDEIIELLDSRVNGRVVVRFRRILRRKLNDSTEVDIRTGRIR